VPSASPAARATTVVASAPSGKIAFVSDRDGNDEIYVLDADGSGLTNLTRNPAADETPAWSPDGTHVAFASERSGFFELYVMDANGGNVRKIEGSHGNNFTPAWSPDGARIAFQCGDKLCIVDAEGNLIDTFGESGSTTGALVGGWSVEGMIAYFWGLTGAGNSGGINVVNEDGSDDEAVLAGEQGSGVYYGEPAWSPDGERLALTSNRDGNWEIYIREADGALTRLTDNPAKEGHPSWSADGNWIAFASDRGGNLDVYIMRTDGSDVRQLTDDPAEERAPVWSAR
jgi:Tol biopolymer transport system component